jgi:tetratricopeptide (TPR) repeat protein
MARGQIAAPLLLRSSNPVSCFQALFEQTRSRPPYISFMQTLKRMVPSALMLLLVVMGFGCSAEAKKSRLLNRADTYFGAGEHDKAKIEYLNVLRVDPQNARAVQRLGSIWYDQGASLRAAPFLLKTRELIPDDIDSRVKLASVFMGVGQIEEARKEALAILEHSPVNEAVLPLLVEASRSQEERDDAEKRLHSLNASDKPGFHIALAALALRKGDVVSATGEVKQALSLDPNSVEAHLALAKIYWLQNDLTKADQEFKAAAELAGPKSVARLVYAEFKLRTGKAAEAKDRLKEITREFPDSLPAWRLLAQIALNEKQFDESLALNENILLRDPANIEARLLQAEIWLAKKEIKKGIEGLERLNTVYPELPVIRYTLARVYLQNNDAAKASVLLNQLVAANPDNLEALLLLGEANLRNGNAQQVVTSMLDLLAKRPDLVPAQILLAQAYQSLGRLDDAAAVFRERIKISPKSAQPYLMLGLILRQQNKIDEARRALEDAQRLAPDNLLVVSHLVDLDLQKREFDTALKRVHVGLEKNPHSAGGHFLEGKIYAAQGSWDRAKAALLKTLELDPNSSSAHDLLISTYLAANKLPQAIQQLESLLSKSPDNARALMLLALTHERMGEFAKARDAYEKLLAIKPDSPPVLNNLAYLYAERLNELDKALELAQKVRALQPGDAAIADTLGWILYKRGDYKEALALLQESAQNLPDNPEIQFHLGMANYMMGRKDEARDAFRQAAAAVNFPDREEAIRRLSMLGDVEFKGTQLSSDRTQVALKEQLDDPLAHVRIAESYEKQGSLAKAAEAYEEAIKLNPSILSANAKLAHLYTGELRDSQKALKFAKKARELAPNDPKVIGILGLAAYQTGNFAWAYSLLEESARGLPKDAEVLYDFAWAAYSLGKVDEARQAMERALDRVPSFNHSTDAKTFLATTALDQEGVDLMAAESNVDQLLKAKADYVPALMVRAAILVQRGESQAAETTYSEILQWFPDFAPAQKRLAALCAQEPEKHDQAYDLAVKARKTLPDDPELAQMLAELSYQRKEFAYAAQLLERSSKERPLDARLLYYLGMSNLKENKQVEAQEALRQALTAGLAEPLASEAKSALAQLENE